MQPKHTQSIDVEMIMSMLSYCRPAGSQTEKEFISRFIEPTGAKPDANDNWILQIGESPIVLWSSHTDTVHKKPGRQDVARDKNGVLYLPAGSKSSCLGADCTAGIWIMLEMIKAKVPGLYVFHAAEEIGMVGSKALLRDTPERLHGIRFAIAFDRRGTDSVITFQSGVRGCSELFASSIARQLPGNYKSDPRGSYTDTRVYFGVVDECTNISVGYYGAHSASEEQDVEHLIRLRDHMIKIDAGQFDVDRNAAAAMAEHLAREKIQNDCHFIRKHAEDVLAMFESFGVSFDDIKTVILQQQQAEFDRKLLTLNDNDSDQLSLTA